MSQVLTVGFITEGTTDVRFLSGIIRRTFDELTWECEQATEVYLSTPLTIQKLGLTFAEYVLKAAALADAEKLMVLCVHTDADDATDATAFTSRISPAFADVQATAKGVCKNLVAIVPVHMTKAWMLADKDALKGEIGTDKTDAQLGLTRLPESIADPKAAINDTIRLAFDHRSRRSRNQVSIGELYEPMGVTADLSKLASLPSYQKFQEAVRDAFRRLNYLH